MPENAIAVRATAPGAQRLVFERAGQVFADSRDVAEFFHKQHNNVLRDIRKLVAEGVLSFEQGAYTLPETGATPYPCFTMNRDGFALLAMGFTGKAALRWKLLYISAFNEMEREIRARTEPDLLRDPVAMRAALLNFTGEVIELRAENAVMAPKVAALDRIATADGAVCVTDAAKALQVAPTALFSYLCERRWIYRRAGGEHWIGYQDRVVAGLLVHKVATITRADGTKKITERVLITPRGLTKLAGLLGKPAPVVGEAA